jgi:hypothetical protein
MLRSAVKYFLIPGMTLLVAACASSMLLNENLQSDADIMAVRRKHIFLGREIVSFGPYFTGKVTRTTPIGEVLDAEMGVKSMKEDIGFEMNMGASFQSTVICTGKLGGEDLSLLKDKEQQEEEEEDNGSELQIEQKDVFKGTIDCAGKCGRWHFLVINSYSIEGDTSLGFLSNGAMRITINEVSTLSSGDVMEGYQLGYEYSLDDRVIGAVDLTEHKKVIISNDIPDDLKFILAGISTALILKSELQRTF